MSKIFISYRRSDSGHVTGRIYDHLLKQYDRDEIFKDVDSIPAASNFKKYIKDTINACDIVLVVIGNSWLTVPDKKGISRLADANDPVRFEIEAALEKGIPVLPLLLDGTEMPDASMLPETLQPLTAINALKVRPDPDFNHDIERLVRAIDNIMALRQPGILNRSRKYLRRSRISAVALTVAVVGIILTVFVLLNNGSGSTKPKDEKPIANQKADSVIINKKDTGSTTIVSNQKKDTMPAAQTIQSTKVIAVKAGQNVYLSVDINEAQPGQSVLTIGSNKTVIARGEIKDILIGKGEGLVGKMIEVVTVVSDANKQTNKISVVDKFKNAAPASFSFNSTVKSEGAMVNVVRSYFFVKAS